MPRTLSAVACGSTFRFRNAATRLQRSGSLNTGLPPAAERRAGLSLITDAVIRPRRSNSTAVGTCVKARVRIDNRVERVVDQCVCYGNYHQVSQECGSFRTSHSIAAVRRQDPDRCSVNLQPRRSRSQCLCTEHFRCAVLRQSTWHVRPCLAGHTNIQHRPHPYRSPGRHQ